MEFWFSPSTSKGCTPAYPYTFAEVVCVLGRKEDEIVGEGEHNAVGSRNGATHKRHGVRRGSAWVVGQRWKKAKWKASEIAWTSFDIPSSVRFAKNWSEKMQFLPYLGERSWWKWGKEGGWRWLFFFFFFLEQELLTRQGTQESKAQISPSALGML